MRIKYLNVSLASVLLMSGCSTTQLREFNCAMGGGTCDKYNLTWSFPPNTSQQDFATAEFDCVNAATYVLPGQQRQPNTVIQQNNTSGNNVAIVDGASNSGGGFVGGAANSLQNSLANQASQPRVHRDFEMFKLCMRAKGYIEVAKPVQ